MPGLEGGTIIYGYIYFKQDCVQRTLSRKQIFGVFSNLLAMGSALDTRQYGRHFLNFSHCSVLVQQRGRRHREISISAGPMHSANNIYSWSSTMLVFLFFSGYV